jgi:Tfp pilus assembly protein PilF
MIYKRHPTLDPNERRENALRPNPRLGYDRDALGMHLMSREAFWIAEPQFRRAVWLNPFEADFKNHLAWCLYKQDKLAEARQWAQKAIDQRDEPNTRVLLGLIGRKLDDRGNKVESCPSTNPL